MIRKLYFVFFCFFAVTLNAQRTNSSPYSFFGVGEEFKSRTVEQITMGGLSAALGSTYQINLSNPAAAGKLKFSTYVFGALNNSLTVKDAQSSQESTSTSISYFALGFPIGKKAGAMFGMQPVSSVGYSLLNRLENSQGELIEITQFSGDGGLNRIHGSLGFQVFKDFSLGIEGSFVFGRVTNEVLTQRDNVFLATKNKEIADIRGGIVKVGLQYEKELKNETFFNVGAILKLSNTLTAKGDEYLYSLTTSAAGNEIPRDTAFAGRLNGELVSPLQTTIGIGYGKKNKWYAGLEYEFKEAFDARGYLNETGGAYAYDNSSRISLGGYYLPKFNSISSYWERITWRAGLRFEKTGLLINGSSTNNNFTSIDDFGISFGFGLPINKKLSSLNFGFELGKRGTTSNSLIQENYFNTRVSLSLTDLWFQKRKIR